MIRIEHLSKNFRGRPALVDLNLEIPRGAMFGLLGHNGAGKSTTFGLILGHVRPTAGEAFVDGYSVQKARPQALRKVGAIFESPAFYDYLSGWENLRILASYSGGAPRAEMEAAVARVNLTGRIHDPVRVYSHGMRQRLALAQALVPRPEILLLDEPTDGLDPEGIHEIREAILRLNREEGMTVVLSSHLLAEVQLMCEEIAILNEGRMIYHGRWDALEKGGQRYRLTVTDWSAAEPVIQQHRGRLLEDGIVEIEAQADVSELVEGLVRAGVRVRGLEPIRPTLERLYLDTVREEPA